MRVLYRGLVYVVRTEQDILDLVRLAKQVPFMALERPTAADILALVWEAQA